MPGAAVAGRQGDGQSPFIDRSQAEMQIKKCEARLDEDEARGRPVSAARRYLEMARSFFKRQLYAKAFFYALRARGLTAELLPR